MVAMMLSGSGGQGEGMGTMRAERNLALRWFGVALLVRLLAGALADLYSTSRGFEGFFPLASGADDRFYWQVVEQYFQGERVYVSNSYPWALIALFFVTGPSLVLGKLLSVVAGALTVYLGVRIVQTVADGHPSGAAGREARDGAAHWAGTLLTFYPSLLFYSTQLVRDAILTLLGFWALYLAMRFLRQPHPLYAGLGLVVLAGLFLFRFYAAVALAASVVLFAFRFRPRWFVPASALAGLGAIAARRGLFGLGMIGQWLDPARIAGFRASTYSIGGSAAGIEIDFSHPLAFLTSYGYSFATAMFGPFPWQLASAVQWIALPEALGLWLLSPIWVWGIITLIRGRLGEDGLLLLFSLVLIGAVALFSDNIGANTRLRLLPWGAFLLFAASRMPRVTLER